MLMHCAILCIACTHQHSDPANLTPIAASFDQAAAAVLIARVAIHRTETVSCVITAAFEAMSVLVAPARWLCWRL
jgi:hypothetical protein